MFFFLIVFAILIGLPGIIFFILGLINKKPGQWVTGIALSLAAFILIVYSIFGIVNASVNLVKRISKNEFKHSYYNNCNTENSKCNDSLGRNTTEMDNSSEDKGVSGFIKGNDNKLTLIHVKIDEQLKSKGVSIDKIENYSPESIKRNGIPIKLAFIETFKGKIILTAYDADNNQISTCSINCFAQKGDNKSFEFDFNSLIRLSDINYCILNESVQ